MTSHHQLAGQQPLARCAFEPAQALDQAAGRSATDRIGRLCQRREARADERCPFGIVEADEAQLAAEVPAQLRHRCCHAQGHHRIAGDHRRLAPPAPGALVQGPQRRFQARGVALFALEDVALDLRCVGGHAVVEGRGPLASGAHPLLRFGDVEQLAPAAVEKMARRPAPSRRRCRARRSPHACRYGAGRPAPRACRAAPPPSTTPAPRPSVLRMKPSTW